MFFFLQIFVRDSIVVVVIVIDDNDNDDASYTQEAQCAGLWRSGPCAHYSGATLRHVVVESTLFLLVLC